MAESYSCNGKWVHFSNGACQVLQLTWAKIAKEMSSDPAMNELSKSLQERSKYATGHSAIGVDAEYLYEPYSRKEIKIAWLNVMKILVNDIANNGKISENMDVSDYE